MYDKNKIEWTYQWPHYDEAVIAIAAAMVGGGETDKSLIIKKSFEVADALARNAQHRSPTRLYASPMVWIREEHDSGKHLSDELLFLWRMASSGMIIPGTFGELIQMIKDMPNADVSKLAGVDSSGDLTSVRVAVIDALQAQR